MQEVKENIIKKTLIFLNIKKFNFYLCIVNGQSCVEPIVIATSEPKQLYVQILLNPEVYSLLKKQVTAALATKVG